jgi:hypothetical protein
MGFVHVDLINKGNSARFDLCCSAIYVNQAG